MPTKGPKSRSAWCGRNAVKPVEDRGKARTSAVTCKTCGGAGQVRSQRGFFVMAQTCPTCHGEGKVIHLPAGLPRSRGGGKSSTLTIKIPAGVREGTSLRISGAGQAGFRGGPSGIFLSSFILCRDQRFTREGDDLYVGEHVSFPQAAMGCEVSVATFEEPVTIKIPPGTQSGALFRLRDHGMPRLEARGQAITSSKSDRGCSERSHDQAAGALARICQNLGEDPSQYDESVLKKIFGRG